ncbi:efflux RND transporter periplasmic adaptor subunit [Mariniradius sediminis]|uniref:Efflux RND transporter periplasmic adaptor subunit n=1 Tax=Mariniradius sediminis TaxID=2909237 RepID=A0ABS9BVT9_9BACT|nr:efflux RND transporter periplasmic adaptor subunit [Mariniradius sediminis]MCF1752184.1 efflux RND transporter periplasmic adaptor subunit [Mariniradius sediminis]
MKTLQSIIFAGMVAVGTLACGSKGETIKTDIPQGRIPVKVLSIEPQGSNIQLQASGKFTTDDETMLSFKTGGIINQVLVGEGDKIKKGQLLATLDLTEVNAGVNQAQLGYEKALRDYERAQRLLADSVATLEQAQNAKTALDIASQVLDAAKFNLSYSQIRAVKDGFVLKKFANVGQQVSAGSPVLQTNGIGKNDWILKATLSDKDWALVKEGSAAKIFTGVEAEKSYAGTVTKKSQSADPMTGTYSVEIEFSGEKPSYLASGMFGSVSIDASEIGNSWYIPFDALLDANGGEGFVFVTADDTTAIKIPVKVGKVLPDRVQITGGLEGYTKLVVTGSAYLSDKSPIQINP